MAANIAAMAPGTNIGAAHPVAGGGQEIKGVMGEKIENFTASFSETIAQRRGRNTDFAIQAVRRSISITDTEALEKRVIDIIAHDVSDLLKQANGREVEIGGVKRTLDFDGVSILRIEMGLKQKVINILAHPNIAYLLMMAGILGLYMEFSNPGALFPGIAGGIARAGAGVVPGSAGQLRGAVADRSRDVSFGGRGVPAEFRAPRHQRSGVSRPGLAAAVRRGGIGPVGGPRIVFAAVGTLSAFVLLVSFLVVKSQRRKATLGYAGLVGELGEVGSAWTSRARCSFMVRCGRPRDRNGWTRATGSKSSDTTA